MTTLLPMDSDNNPIPALRFKNNGAHSINVSATSARNTVAFDTNTKIVSLYTTVPVYLVLGDSTITATSTDHYFPAGVYYDIAIGDERSGQATHIAALRAEGDGTLYISEKQ